MQCTDRYSITSGRSWAPFASMNLSLMKSTRSSLHPTAGLHGQCWKKSTLFHLLESFSLFPETCLCSLDQFSPECQYVHFMVLCVNMDISWNGIPPCIVSHSNSVPTPGPTQLQISISPLSSGRQFCLNTAPNRQLQQFPVGLGH